ncbi:MAG: tRNA (N(6)-L-threonylcarbamoyladenosine(37)-C(2))-methylthiotransferase MtaB [Thermoleophilia bacterium]
MGELLALGVGTVAFRTLGCKLNQCETAQMEESLTERGVRLVPWSSPADVRVLNTCTVTGRTDRTCRNEIRRVAREDPGARLIVTGCYAQVAADVIAAIPGVNLVLGNLDKSELAGHVAALLGSDSDATDSDATGSAQRSTQASPAHVTSYSSTTTIRDDFVTHFSGYTRAFLKVQNGCDSRCSYCVIPLARGPSRSMPLARVVGQVRLLTERDYREVVLTGIHLGTWGRDTDEGSLPNLLEALVATTDMPRFRLSSIEPLEVDDRVLEVMRTERERFAEHFHLPLQSGSDSVLRRMNRPYDAAGYTERVEAVRRAFPDSAIGADVIVGFPGETEAEFEETVALVERLPLTYLHVFPYSDRPGTAASLAPSKVPPHDVAERAARLRRVGRAKDVAFQRKFAGHELTALLLRQRSADGLIVGLTGNYLEVLVEGHDSQMNRLEPVVPSVRRPDGRWEGRIA